MRQKWIFFPDEERPKSDEILKIKLCTDMPRIYGIRLFKKMDRRKKNYKVKIIDKPHNLVFRVQGLSINRMSRPWIRFCYYQG